MSFKQNSCGITREISNACHQKFLLIIIIRKCFMQIMIFNLSPAAPFTSPRLIFLVGVICLIAIPWAMYQILKNPYEYPYFEKSFNVTRKRKPDIEDYIDNYLIENGLSEINAQNNKITKWKEGCEADLSQRWLRKYRRSQYNEVLDDEEAFIFSFERERTRYRQHNYERTSYKVLQNDGDYACDYDYLLDRYEKLKKIGFECTLREYHAKNQRSLMKPALRKKIMKRDNYTCQICGKHMPDEVGLQIDHIVPVSKGGKSVESNLQVLCSKCNGYKSNKMDSELAGIT